MTEKFQHLLNIVQESGKLSDHEKNAILKLVKEANKDLVISAFKIERLEKVKHTTTVLLEQTIEELEAKRKAVEKQKHELEIEAALERVRAKTLAMQNSQDVSMATAVMFNELSRLGVEKMRCGIGILQHDADLMEVCTAATTKDGHEIKGAGLVGINGHALWQQMYAN